MHISHPWHGVDIGEKSPNIVKAFIEITPSDTMKYEIDKISGILKVDRPQKFSNVVPALYGFIPQTYCDIEIAKLANVKRGDQDPLDILVLTSHHISHGNIILNAKIIGGFCLIDNQEADDKIIAVLEGDEVFSIANNLDDLSPEYIDKLKHYFLTYKNLPNQIPTCQISSIYNSEHAYRVIKASSLDYKNSFRT